MIYTTWGFSCGSAGKESICNVGYVGYILGLGRSPGEGKGYLHPVSCMKLENMINGKKSTCNAGNSSSILGSGRSAGEGIGYPLQYSWASLVTRLVKNLPAMWETSVQSLGWGDPLEKGKATHSSILAYRIP